MSRRMMIAGNCYAAGTTDQPAGWATSHFAHEVGHVFGPRHPWESFKPLRDELRALLQDQPSIPPGGRSERGGVP